MSKLRSFIAIPVNLREWTRWIQRQTIGDDGSVALPELEDIADQTILGNNDGSASAPEALTAAEVADIVEGSIDHGSIAGLTDDDHTQYLTETRHDALAADNPHSVTLEQVLGTTVTVTSTSYTAVAAEYRLNVDDDSAGGQVTINLPTASAIKKIYEIKKQGTTANVVIDGNGSDTIDGGLTAILTVQDENLTIGADGVTNWDIL